MSTTDITGVRSAEAMVGFLSFGDFGYLGFLVDGVSCRWTFTVPSLLTV